MYKPPRPFVSFVSALGHLLFSTPFSYFFSFFSKRCRASRCRNKQSWFLGLGARCFAPFFVHVFADVVVVFAVICYYKRTWCAVCVRLLPRWEINERTSTTHNLARRAEHSKEERRNLDRHLIARMLFFCHVIFFFFFSLLLPRCCCFCCRFLYIRWRSRRIVVVYSITV